MLLFQGWRIDDGNFGVQSSDFRGVSLPALFPRGRAIIGTVPKSPFATCSSGLKRIIHENSR
ncbi:hypothetical protein HU200_061518 [Digitaria exilis]|uniref:Uncharacterized protein n=1 Tax=Digitaria exilis TaxID=1010633 RepID=A0A835DXR2_9POAL|nr:hypothetical protein HU200_061518 [Digitaria exilis]